METTKTQSPKLSTLLREGAAKIPPCVGRYTDGLGCCALGTIDYVLRGYISDHNPCDIIAEATGVDLSQSIKWTDTSALPEESGKNDPESALFDILVNLNDKARMSREEIANWLESVGL